MQGDEPCPRRLSSGERRFVIFCNRKGNSLRYLISGERVSVSGDKGFEPVRQLHEFELTWMLRAIKRVAHDDLAQFGFCIDIAEHAIEQIEQPLQIVMSITCWIWPKGLEQASSLRRCNLLHALHHLSPLLFCRNQEARGNLCMRKE